MKFPFENVSNFSQTLRELAIGLLRLDLVENFESVELDVNIEAGQEAKIRNPLSFIPSRYIISSQKGNSLVTRSETTWTRDFLYLTNNGTNPVILKIIFMR